MIIAFLMAFFVVGSFQAFSLNWSIQALNKAIIYTPIETMFKYVIPREGKPYFDTGKIEKNLLDYYDGILPKYTKDYNVEILFYNKENHSLCGEDFCNSIDIYFQATLTFKYQYTRQMYYELGDGSFHG